MLAEAGVKVAVLTFSAAVLHSASHLLYDPPKDGFLATGERDGEVEAYGESPSYPIFSASFDPPGERGLQQAQAELRLPEGSETVKLENVLPAAAAMPADLDLRSVVLPYAAALASACPRRSLRINLLPEDQRVANSRAMFIPTMVLAVLVLLMAGAVLGYSALENRRYLRHLEAEIARTEPLARKSADLDRAIQTAQRRSVVLDDVRRRSKQDLDALNELTHLVAPPAWVSSLDLTRTSVQFAGEAEQAAGLLKLLDSSPNFEHSEFTVSLTRVASGESFAIRSDRKGVSK
jgi:Tfp pilus assembly protein PilN